MSIEKIVCRRNPYDMIFAIPYPPFGEVVDYTYNSDGTITLIVDAVWADCNSDIAFTNCIVVQPFEDGTFRYLSYSIEKKELDIPVVRNCRKITHASWLVYFSDCTGQKASM